MRPDAHAEILQRKDWAEQALAYPLTLAQQGRSLAQVALAGTQRMHLWDHYPRRDAVDSVRATRFYYHAHPSRRPHPQEHGHFHLFAPGPRSGGFVHLAALSLDAQGRPLRWFTTNLWVTGEQTAPVAHRLQALAVFDVQLRGPLAPLARWLVAMTRLFEPHLQALTLRHVRMVQRWALTHDAAQVDQDRRLDVVAQCSADWTRALIPIQPGPPSPLSPGDLSS